MATTIRRLYTRQEKCCHQSSDSVGVGGSRNEHYLSAKVRLKRMKSKSLRKVSNYHVIINLASTAPSSLKTFYVLAAGLGVRLCCSTSVIRACCLKRTRTIRL